MYATVPSEISYCKTARLPPLIGEHANGEFQRRSRPGLWGHLASPKSEVADCCRYRVTGLRFSSMTYARIHPDLTEDQFRNRFIRAVIAIGFRDGRLPFGRDPGGYAADVAPSYWLVYVSDGGTPEKYATEDASFWE